MIDPPGIWVKYDCLSKMVKLGVEWLGDFDECRVTRMIIDWNKTNSEELLWELEMEEIEAIQKRFELNWYDLTGFMRIVGKYDLLSLSDSYISKIAKNRVLFFIISCLLEILSGERYGYNLFVIFFRKII